MSAKNSLHRLAVSSPCSQDWNSMIGNDRVRFCEHCSLHVHNISEMTRAKALRLISDSQGRLCVRYHSTAEREIVTRSSQRGAVYQIGRRVSQIAAGAFSASLSLSTVIAEPASPVRPNVVVSEGVVRPNDPRNDGSVVGIVMDQNGAVIPGVSVMISNAQTGLAMELHSNDTGEFRFDGLPAGSYTMRLHAPGFRPLEVTEVYVDRTGEARLNLTLEVAEIHTTMGVVAISGPSNPFVKAAQEDDLETVQTLIADTDVNVRDQDTGTTALDHAVQNGNREMVQLLLSRGADVNAADEIGRTPLMLLGEDATAELLWDLINAGAKVNHKDASGETALMQAATRNNPDIVKELLEAGAEVNVADDDGTTALMMAAASGRVNNVRALFLAGAIIDAQDTEGRNALMHAVEDEHPAVIRFLRSKGAVVIMSPDNEK